MSVKKLTTPLDALIFFTLQPYALICRYIAPLTPWVPLLFALDQQLIVSSAALLTSLILVSRETLLQARLLPMALSAATLSMAFVQVRSGGGGNPSLVSSMPPSVVPGPVDPASAPASSGRGN